jgi:hypothetical protein
MVVILLLSPTIATADDQSIADLQKNLSDLKKINDELVASKTTESKVKYEEVRNALFNVLENLPLVRTKYEAAIKEKNTSELLIDLGDATNPSSSALGKKFTDIIIDTAKTRFITVQKDTSNWNRFLSTVDKILKNPLVDNMVKSNPISSLVGSVIQTASGFSDTQTSGILGKSIVTKDIISTAEINEFCKDIAPYVAFYEGVSEATRDFQAQQNYLEKRNSAIASTIYGYDSKFISSLGLISDTSNHQPYTSQLSTIFEIRNIPITYNDYDKVINNKNIKDGYIISSRFSTLEDDVKEFQGEVSDVLSVYLKSYRSSLVNLKGMPTEFSSEKIDSYIKKIDTYVKRNSTEFKTVVLPTGTTPEIIERRKTITIMKFDLFKSLQ